MIRTALAAPLILLATLAGPAPAAAERTLDYLYIDGSEGGGSGGHAALALGDRAFHFEHRAPGLLALAREPLAAVHHRYGVLFNRTIEISHIPVSEATYALVLDELTRRHFVQRQHLTDHQSATDDRRLLEAALARAVGAPAPEPLMLDGAGFFVDDVGAAPPDEAGAAPALRRLRERLEAELGADVLPAALARIDRELAGLAPGAPAPSEALAADRIGPAPAGLAQRYRDGVLARLALEVLGDARPLRPGSLAPAPGPALAAEDEALVARLHEALESSLVRLVQSRRPDRGFPLLLGMARLTALDDTRRTGRWVFLDVAGTAVIRRDRLAGEPGLAAGLRHRTARDFAAAREGLRRRGRAAEGFPEADVVELEAAGNRLVEVEMGLRDGRDLRLAWGAPVPARPAALRAPRLPAMAPDDLRRSLDAARASEAAHAAGLARLYGYNVVTRNCVTELFRTIDAALARDVLAREPGLDAAALADRVRAASIERLGGYIDPTAGLNFVPAVSALSVQDGYAGARVEEIPSYRRARLAAMSAREPSALVVLRESNTLTSTLYTRTPDDSAFLFFTDTARVARPLLGAANVLTGLGVAAAGLVTLPADGGARLRAGLTGVMFSLPELAFFNIRKGSFSDLARRPASLAAEDPERFLGEQPAGAEEAHGER